MKKIISFLTILTAMTTVSLGACTHTHKYGAWETIRAATCSNMGIQRRFCKCDEYEERETDMTEHDFSAWVSNGTVSQSRTCYACGFSDIQYYKDIENAGGNTTDADTIAYGHYGNFENFWNACKNSRYNATSKKIEVVLDPGSIHCDGKTVYIPEYVTDIVFIGNTRGNPYYDFKIIIDQRTTDINITFRDVRIEANGTIFASETRNINVNIFMEGTQCNLINTSTAASGSQGKDVNATTTGNASGREGGRGSDGSPALLINGNCTIDCTASLLIIKGGNGGNGGRGGNASLGSGARGGDGGNGGKAVSGENLAIVNVAPGCTADIVGGNGGNGGNGGSGFNFGNSPGGNGNNGSQGSSGCSINYL